MFTPFIGTTREGHYRIYLHNTVLLRTSYYSIKVKTVRNCVLSFKINACPIHTITITSRYDLYWLTRRTLRQFSNIFFCDFSLITSFLL